MTPGTVHDLGYKRYLGGRRAQSTRWTVIARQTAAYSWTTWWRFKVPLALAVINTAVFVVLLTALDGLGIRDGLSRFLDAAPEDALIALSYGGGFGWYCKAAFIVTMTVGARAVAGDIQSGAFVFYFSRPVRPIDYVVGKIAGLFVLLSLFFVGGPLILALVRLGLYGDLGEILASIAVIPKVLIIGVLAALAYATVPLGISALVRTRRHALALWAAYYVIVGGIISAIGVHLVPWVGALDLATAVSSLAFRWLEVGDIRGRIGNIPAGLAATSLVIHVAAATAILYWRVNTEKHAGVGGAS
jgi:ABC-type transport system involved in multi-copper enzyme maturation permease subunit